MCTSTVRVSIRSGSLTPQASRSKYGKYQRQLSELVQNGSAADVDRASAEYARKNQQLAADLGSRTVLDNISEAQRVAADTKRAQEQSSAQREISSKRMKAGASFKRRADAYLSDPKRGLSARADSTDRAAPINYAYVLARTRDRDHRRCLCVVRRLLLPTVEDRLSRWRE
jgi:hypothetical protein